MSQAVYDSGKIYNIGGFNDTSGVTNITRIYTIGTNTWTTGAPMPAALTDHATILWNGVIYVVGGYNGSATVNTLYAYNIAGNSWTTLAPLPGPLFLPGAGAINNKLYVASGNDGSVQVNTLRIYDIPTNTWTTGATVPTAVTAPGSTMFNGNLYVFGGGFPTTTNITQIYNPNTNTWSSGPNMVVNRLWFFGAVVGGSIIAPGGDQSPGIPINDNEQFTGGGACGTPSPTPTPTPTPSASPTPAPPTMQFSMAAFPGDESQVEPVIITRTGNVTGSSSVNFSATSGTATGGVACTAGVDFVTILNQVVQFNPGETEQDGVRDNMRGYIDRRARDCKPYVEQPDRRHHRNA